jgi:hypothetical protein
MSESDLTKLRRARLRVHAQLRKREPLVAGYHAKLADLETRIQALDPQLPLLARKRDPNPLFKRGELPRIVMDIMRDTGGPIAVRVVALQALAMKGHTMPEARLRRAIRRDVSQLMAQWGKRGLVVSVGHGKGTRRVLVARVSS